MYYQKANIIIGAKVLAIVIQGSKQLFSFSIAFAVLTLQCLNRDPQSADTKVVTGC